MAKPDFIIIGAQRAGTTSLFQYLNHHPDLAGPRLKEKLYVDCDSVKILLNDSVYVHVKSKQVLIFNEGEIKETAYFSRLWGVVPIERYWSMFTQGKINFEASPDYLDMPGVPERIKSAMPDVKIIVLLREPGVRAWSHYWHETKCLESETLPFDAAIERDLVTDYDFYHYSYLRRGCYKEHLERWLQYFPAENLFIQTSENLFKNPDKVFKEVQQFMGLEKIAELDQYHEHTTIPNGYPEMPEIYRSLMDDYYKVKNEGLEELVNGGQLLW
jgi:hypothetical protein